MGSRCQLACCNEMNRSMRCFLSCNSHLPPAPCQHDIDCNSMQWIQQKNRLDARLLKKRKGSQKTVDGATKPHKRVKEM